MSAESQRKIKPISKDGIVSIEKQIKRHMDKAKRALELKDLLSAEKNLMTVVSLKERLRGRTRVTGDHEVYPVRILEIY